MAEIEDDRNHPLLSRVLVELLELAGQVLTRPAPVRMTSRLPDGFVYLAQQVERAHAQPTDTIRCTNAAKMVKDAIRHFHDASTEDRAARWLMVIGQLLPMLRDDAEQALRNEREHR
jgi:hypothetical protein